MRFFVEKSMNALNISIIGSTGYTGQELVRWLRRHPQVGKIKLASQQKAGQPLPAILRRANQLLAPHYFHPDDDILKESQVVFFATPNGIALKHAKAFVDAHCRVIDLSADFRLRDAKIYQHWYGQTHTESTLLSEATYGLVEMNRQAIASAKIVANPGCYASAVLLGLIPLFRAGIITSPMIADVKSGVSGAGKKLESQYLFHEVNESLHAYAVTGHRHHPEIVQGLTATLSNNNDAPELIFTPHLVPMQRGILATLHVRKAPPCSEGLIRDTYQAFYDNCPFIHLHEPDKMPNTADVIHTNMVSIGYHLRDSANIMTIVVALDNMVKGASGQAIQSMNVMLGLNETTGLV